LFFVFDFLVTNDIYNGNVDFAMVPTNLPNFFNPAPYQYNFPAVINSWEMTYNLPELPANYQLIFTADIAARIYLGNITQWNDPAIKAVNPDVAAILDTITNPMRVLCLFLFFF
jgi:phosphate transport system substrate-binding protein